MPQAVPVSTMTRHLAAIGAAAAVAVGVTAAAILAAYFVLGDQQQLLMKLRTEAPQGFLAAQFRPLLLRRDHPMPVWGNNECMIVYMVVAPDYDTRWKEAISPLSPAGPSLDSCDSLRALLAGKRVSGAYYHRYLHGYRLATALLLTALPARAIPWTVDAGIHALVLALLAAALARAATADRKAEGLGYAIVAGCLLAFWCLQDFGSSISFVFGDAVVVGMIGWLFLFNPLRMRERTYLFGCATAGALIAHFEFLTGQTPLATAALPVCLVISSLSEPNGALLVRRAVIGPCVLLLTLGLCFAVKYAVVALVFGAGILGNLLYQGSHLVAGSLDIGLAPAAASLLRSLGLPTTFTGGALNTAFWVIASIAFATPAIGLGSFYFGAAVLLLSVAMIGAGCVRPAGRPMASIERARMFVLLGSVGLLAGWYLLFPRHTILHAGYMIRPLVLLPIIAAITWLCRTRTVRKQFLPDAADMRDRPSCRA